MQKPNQKYKLLPTVEPNNGGLYSSILREGIDDLKARIDKELFKLHNQSHFVLSQPIDQLSKKAITDANRQTEFIQQIAGLIQHYEDMISHLHNVAGDARKEVEKVTEVARKQKTELLRVCLKQKTKVTPSLLIQNQSLPPEQEVFY